MLICLKNEHILRLMAGDNHSFMVSVYVSLNKVFGRVESLLPMLHVRVAVLMVLVQLVEAGFVDLLLLVSGVRIHESSLLLVPSCFSLCR